MKKSYKLIDHTADFGMQVFGSDSKELFINAALALFDVITEMDVHAELGEVITGKRPGRTSKDEIIIYDATGTALQDTAAAAALYERALERGVGTTMEITA